MRVQLETHSTSTARLVWMEASFLFNKNMTARIRFAKLHLNKTKKTSGTMSLGYMRPEWNCLGISHSTAFRENPNTAYQEKHLIPPVKHGCRMVMNSASCATIGDY